MRGIRGAVKLTEDPRLQTDVRAGMRGVIGHRKGALDDVKGRSMPDTFQDNESVLHQFNKLVQELLRGSITRNTFRQWEIDILLDIDGCDLRDGSRRQTVRKRPQDTPSFPQRWRVTKRPALVSWTKLMKRRSSGRGR